MRISGLWIALFILLVPGLLLAPAWLAGGLGAGEDDVLYYYPSRLFFHQTIADGHWPWMNPSTGLGRPFVADPQSAVWYPPTWLFAVITPRVAYPLSLWLHYALAVWGMYRLLRSQSLERQAALFGGVAFAFCGFMLAHRAHFSMLTAAAWTPWVLWRLRQFDLRGGAGRLAAAAAVATLQCLAGHVQIAAITALGSLVYLLFASESRGRALLSWITVWFATAGLYAVQWLPTLAYVLQCTRVDNDYWDFTQNSWNPVSAIALLMPMLLGQRTPNWFDQSWWGPSHQVEQFAYAGIVPLLLALIAIRSGCRESRRRWALCMMGLFGLLLALGKYGPVCPLLYWAPGSSLFRVPARAILLVNLAVAALAAFALNDLCSNLSPKRVRLRAVAMSWTRRPLLTALALTLSVVAVVVVALPFLDRTTFDAAVHAIRPLNPAVCVALAVIVASLIVVGRLARRWQRRGPAWPLLALTIVDLGIIGWSIDIPKPPTTMSDLLNPPSRRQWSQHLAADSGRLWVVTDTAGVYGDPIAKGAANTNILLGIESLNDYGPLQPKLMRRRFKFAAWGVSEIAEQLLRESSWMGPCNVAWILLCDPRLPAPTGCELVTSTENGFRLYHNPTVFGEAFIEQDGAVLPAAAERLSPQSIITHVPANRSGPGSRRLVLSRLAIPGWTARTGDAELPIEISHEVLMSVQVPSQAGDVLWSYRPPLQFAGAALSITTAAALLAATLFGRKVRQSPE